MLQHCSYAYFRDTSQILILVSYQVSVHECILEQWCDSVDIILAHFAYVLKEKGERLEHTVLHVELGHPVLVHQRRQHGEGRTRFGNDGDGHRGADTVLPLLHLQVVEQGGQHVVRPNGLGDVAKRVDGRSADCFFVRLQQLEQLKADAHPLTSRHVLRTSIRNPTHQVNAVFLHLELIALLLLLK
jgi:hypothetical protein